MLKHYSRIRMEAKRRALEAIVEKKADAKPPIPTEVPTLEVALMGNSKAVPTKAPTMDRVN